MNPPESPETPFTPNGSSGPGPASAHTDMVISRRTGCRQNDSVRVPTPIRVNTPVEPRSARTRQLDESGTRSPDSKRRRFHPQIALRANPQRTNSPNSPYPVSPYTPRYDGSHHRGSVQGVQPPRSYRPLNGKPHPSHDPSLKLPPLQTDTAPPTTTPATPFSLDGSSVEDTVKAVPCLNKIRLLARISPTLSPPFRHADTQRRGPVIAVDGQDSAVVRTVVEYLSGALKTEGKYHVRVFEGPDPRPVEGASDPGQAKMHYFNTIMGWHGVSNEVVNFVKSQCDDTKSASDDSTSSVSPKTIISKTAGLRVASPATSTETGTESSPSPARSAASFLPVALVAQYQLSTSDAYACSIPIDDQYTALDHWQWMATLWRGFVGPDVIVYIRECEKEEMDRLGGNPVDVRLRDARTIVVRRAAGSSDLEEKTLKRVGFELEDFLAQ